MDSRIAPGMPGVLDGCPTFPRISCGACWRGSNFMRLSSLKAAHAERDGATYRKSGSPQRTWAENDLFPMLSLNHSPELTCAKRSMGLTPDFLCSGNSCMSQKLLGLLARGDGSLCSTIVLIERIGGDPTAHHHHRHAWAGMGCPSRQVQALQVRTGIGRLETLHSNGRGWRYRKSLHSAPGIDYEYRPA